ncbi:MAG: cellulase N-terminal Ig-like domain-containing protein, partial [Longimicrobiales bacterium]
MTIRTTAAGVSATVALACTLTACAAAPEPELAAAIRYNQLGYLPDAPKVAVVCSLDGRLPRTFHVTD